MLDQFTKYIRTGGFVSLVYACSHISFVLVLAEDFFFWIHYVRMGVKNALHSAIETKSEREMCKWLFMHFSRESKLKSIDSWRRTVVGITSRRTYECANKGMWMFICVKLNVLLPSFLTSKIQKNKIVNNLFNNFHQVSVLIRKMGGRVAGKVSFSGNYNSGSK